MKNSKRNVKGITLITLVITIIILLILAGVTLNTVISQNGLFERAKASVEKYNLESEREYLEQNVLSVQTDQYFDTVSSKKSGIELIPRNIEHTTDWHYIKVENISYGRYDTDKGWYFIKKDTELSNYGSARYNWLVNYETGDIIQVEENNYIDLSAEDMVAIKDNLIINIDSSILDTIDQNLDSEQKQVELEKQLGNSVKLHNFSFNEESNLTSTSFDFDGIDDYITFNYNDSTKISGGFTLEFYGKIKKGGQLYNYDTHEKFIDPNGNVLNGFVELSNPNFRKDASALAFGIDTEQNGEQKIKQLAWRLGNKLHNIPDGFQR